LGHRDVTDTPYPGYTTWTSTYHNIGKSTGVRTSRIICVANQLEVVRVNRPNSSSCIIFLPCKLSNILSIRTLTNITIILSRYTGEFSSRLWRVGGRNQDLPEAVNLLLQSGTSVDISTDRIGWDDLDIIHRQARQRPALSIPSHLARRNDE
jgi:hypothetical protein